MRNYQYTPQEEEEMDAFGNEWKKTNRGIKGPSAWREFKQKHPWAKRITADALRQKYTRLKRDQYWRAYAVTHQNCPRGHAVCYANPNNQPSSLNSVISSIDSYVTSATTTIAPSSPLPVIGASSSPIFTPSTVVSSSSPSTSASPNAASPSNATVSSSPIVASTPAQSTSSNVNASNTNNIVQGSSDASKTQSPNSAAVNATPVAVSQTNQKQGQGNSDEYDALAAAIAAILGQSSTASLNFDQIKGTTSAPTSSSSATKEETKPGQKIEKPEAEMVFERILELINGKLTPTTIDGRLMLVPTNEGSNVKPIAVRDLLHHVKALLLKFLRDKCGDFEKTLGIKHPTSTLEQFREMTKKLLEFLGADIDKLIDSLLENTK